MPQKQNPVGSMWTPCSPPRSPAAIPRCSSTRRREHERAAGSWHAEWHALSGALATTGGAAAALGALAGLEVDDARMRENLALTGGVVATERLALILTERVGTGPRRASSCGTRRSAQRRAAVPLPRSSRTSTRGSRPIELGWRLDPTTYLGSAGVLVDRALALHEAERSRRDDATSHYRLDGPADAPPLVMASSLGTTHAMWEPQVT